MSIGKDNASHSLRSRSSNEQCHYLTPESTCLHCRIYNFPCGPKITSFQVPKFLTDVIVSASIPLIPTPRIPKSPLRPDATIDTLDTKYFYLFLNSMPRILDYCTLFPTMVSDIFSSGVENACVRHTILTTASMMADYYLQR